jgi:hypothetical protein
MADIKLFENIDWFFLFGILTLLVILFVVIGSVIMPNKHECTLYFVGNDDAVCDGVLIESKDYGSHYSFVCKDGKVLRELTNFRVEELHK